MGRVGLTDDVGNGVSLFCPTCPIPALSTSLKHYLMPPCVHSSGPPRLGISTPWNRTQAPDGTLSF